MSGSLSMMKAVVILVADFQAFVRTIVGPSPKAAKRPLDLGIHCKSAGVGVVGELEVEVAAGVVEPIAGVDAEVGIVYYTVLEGH